MRQRLFLLLCLSATLFFGSCQRRAELNSPPLPKSTSEQKFPKNWSGHWQGPLDIYKDTGWVQRIDMQLDIEAIPHTDHYKWIISYGDTEPRNYELQPIDIHKGLYLIDEKNTIKIEGYFFSNRFLSWYTVEGHQMLISYEKRDQQLVFEVVAGSTRAVSVTGNTGEGKEKIPAVSTFPIATMQRAVLVKREE